MNFNSDALKDYDRHELLDLQTELYEANAHVIGDDWHYIFEAVNGELQNRIRVDIQNDHRRLFRPKPTLDEEIARQDTLRAQQDIYNLRLAELQQQEALRGQRQ